MKRLRVDIEVSTEQHVFWVPLIRTHFRVKAFSRFTKRSISCIVSLMDIFAFSPSDLASFLLTLMRVSFVVFLMPFYGADYIPIRVKASLCLILSLAIWPHLSFPGDLLPAHPFALFAMLTMEALLGLTLGLCVHFVFAGIQTGGEILGFQMGFTMVTLADPSSGARVSVTSHLMYMVTLIVFIFLNGHLYLLQALAESFRLIPPGGFRITASVADTILVLSAGMFVLAIKIAAPVIAALFMVELTLALMGRAAPQMNLLTLGFPIKIAVGFFFISMLFSTLSVQLNEIIIGFSHLFTSLMEAAR